MKDISPELQILDDLLMEIHDRIKSGRCLTNKQQNIRAISFLNMIANKDEYVSKYEACQYIGISRSTFDRAVVAGEIPEGKKRAGLKEKTWAKKDLDEYIDRLL